MDKLNLCPSCNKARASTRKSRLCGTCHKKAVAKRVAQSATPAVVSSEILAKVALAKTTEDWQVLAAEMAPVIADILNGTVKATAAQASLIKDIMNRAYGKPIAAQMEKRAAAGLIVLPVLDYGVKMTICPNCGYNATKTLVDPESRAANSFPKLDSKRSDVRGSGGGREDGRADSAGSEVGGPSETPLSDAQTDQTAIAGSDRPDVTAVS